METEIWKPIIGYEGLYEISNIGRVKSLNYLRSWKERILRWWSQRFYKMYIIRKDNKNVPVISHRLVWIHFIDNPLNLPCVLHKDETLIDWLLYNWEDNLYWWTHKDNMQDKFNKWRANNHYQLNHPTRWKFWKDMHTSKTVLQYNKLWELIKKWECSKEVTRITWISYQNISACCRWKRKAAWWYIWKYI